MFYVSKILTGFSLFLLQGVTCKGVNGLSNGKELFEYYMDLQNFCSLETMFLARKVSPDGCQGCQCFFRFTKCLVSCLNVKNDFPLSILRVGVDNITSTSGILSIMFLLSSRKLSNVSLGVDLAASFVPGWIISTFSE